MHPLTPTPSSEECLTRTLISQPPNSPLLPLPNNLDNPLLHHRLHHLCKLGMVHRDGRLIIQRPDRRCPLEAHTARGIDEREDLAFEVGTETPRLGARAGVD